MPSIPVDGARIPALQGETILEAMERAAVPFSVHVPFGQLRNLQVRVLGGQGVAATGARGARRRNLMQTTRGIAVAMIGVGQKRARRSGSVAAPNTLEPT